MSAVGELAAMAWLGRDALRLLGQICEDIYLRSSQLADGGGVPHAGRHDLAQRAIACYETLLKMSMPQSTSKFSQGAHVDGHPIVMSILRLKTFTMGTAARAGLLDAIESLVLSSTERNPETEELRGVGYLQPRTDTRAVAAKALRTGTADLPVRIALLCQAVARDATLSSVPPSTWFDQQVRCLSAKGYAGLATLDDHCTLAVLQILDLCRFFGADSFLKDHRSVRALDGLRG
eukprot:gnl/TRDRNA2_/TRDRNA2_127793_c1_seq1.p1 gnl/TRDRNA2_/TRDRNA2_127793_c1~~gnl/TRDRNA2_/TRDRNA2_127793_c1_seq1.p1  ORF type:complete len:234 (-),score=33.08 gnl/TRDRNA2_/TRDRNA2_127793_c1_seq1:58-759(-)